MITAKVAYEIFQIFALKENEELPNEKKRQLVEKIVIDVYNNGVRSGHNKAVKMCKDALNNLEI